MKTFKSIKSLRKYILSLKKEGDSIGFVPTMGFLHAGHIELIKKCVSENDISVVSIYVNPKQFGEGEDFSDYPRDINRDMEILENERVDILFYPENSEMYPEKQLALVDVRGLSDVLCGKRRPGHFMGVATVVLKLFNIVNPDMAYFGQKDAQQLVIIKKMVKDLNVSVRIKSIPIIRDDNGLALSSRNSYLSNNEKIIATQLSKALFKAKSMIENDNILDPLKIIDFIQERLKKTGGINIDYVEIRRLTDLSESGIIDRKDCIVAVAIYIGKVRLIDNFILGEI